MTQIYASDMPATGDEEPPRPWALNASLALSTFGIAFSLVAWVWANGQQIDYDDLQLNDVGVTSGLEYVPIYLLSMLIAGLSSLALAAAGARSNRDRPWVAVAAGAIAMFLVMVPVVFFVSHEVSHWCVDCATTSGD